MAENKTIKKYAWIIWIVLMLACLMRNAYNIYNFWTITPPDGSLEIFIAIARIVLEEAVVPTLVVFLLSLILVSIGTARFVRCVPRTDFVYSAMSFTAAARFIVGFIDIFSILNPAINVFASTFLDFAVASAAYLVMFFVFFKKIYKFNPVEEYNAFRMWSTIYMVAAGVIVVLGNIGMLALLDGSPLSMELIGLLRDFGYLMTGETMQKAASIAGICIYFAYLIAVIVAGEIMRRNSKLFRDPETRGDYYKKHEKRPYKMRKDTDETFSDIFANAESYESGNGNPENHKHETHKKEESVFDEFDI